MSLISAEYVEQNRLLHESNEAYGVTGLRWAGEVIEIADALGTKDILDYGCGKGLLLEALREKGYEARGYDPAVPKYATPPEPADLVVCTDVLEHIEPECIEAVLDDLKRLTRKAAFFIISTRTSAKTLPDGRNSHLIVKHCNLWLWDMMQRYIIVRFRDGGQGCAITVVAHTPR